MTRAALAALCTCFVTLVCLGNLEVWTAPSLDGTGYHVLDTYLLKNDLVHSLAGLHTQPPVFNLLIAAALKSGSPHGFFTVYVLVSLFAFFWSMGVVGSALGRRWWLLPLAFLLLPFTYIQSHFVFYDWLCVVFVALAAACITLRRWLWAAGVLALLCLTRAHVVWWLVLPFIWWFSGRNWKATLVFAVPVGAWILKNLLFFGIFSVGNWDGYTMTRGTPYNGNWWYGFNSPEIIRMTQENSPLFDSCFYPVKRSGYRNWNHYYQREAAKILPQKANEWRKANPGAYFEHCVYFGLCRGPASMTKYYVTMEKSRSWFRRYTDWCTDVQNACLIRYDPRVQERLVAWLSTDDRNNPWVPFGLVLWVIGLAGVFALPTPLRVFGLGLTAWLWGSAAITDGNEIPRFLYPVVPFMVFGWVWIGARAYDTVRALWKGKIDVR